MNEEMDVQITEDETFNVRFGLDETINLAVYEGNVVLDQNYEHLTNKPKINSVELIGNKTSEELGIETEAISAIELAEILV